MTTESHKSAERKSTVRDPLLKGQLVRGQEARLLEGIGALVVKHNVTLDLGSVERIDAAGVAALVGLYRSAQTTGHRFQVANVTARVAKVLELVGLEGLLVSHNPVQGSHYEECMQRPAA
jgi:anti-anti-sigma factor